MCGETMIDHTLKRLQDLELVLNETTIVVFTDQKGIITYANDKFCALSGFTKEELIGQPQSIVNSGYHDPSFFKYMWETIGTGEIWHGEIKNKTKAGSYYWVDTYIVPFLNEKGKPYQYVSIRNDITKLKEQEAMIKNLAFKDYLTNLPNRTWLNEWLKKQKNETIENLTVLFLDVDHFKSINDTFGHNIGDMIIKDVAERLRNSINPNDFIIRQGGDEFIIFLNDINSNKDKVLEVIQKIKKQFQLPFYNKGEQLFLSISIGINMNVTKIKENNYLEVIDIAISRADNAMYYAKKQFGNTHCFNTEDQNNEVDRYYQIIIHLKKAIRNNEFYLLYQPVMDIVNEKIIAAEALLRWENSELGPISPTTFVPLLEEIGLIYDVGNWVLECSTKQMKHWLDLGMQLERISVNVSPLQFNNGNLVDNVKKALYDAQLPARYLELEITESTIMDFEKAEKVLIELGKLGVSISIDDFGTGYSSLSYLTRLPINTLKIDKSFIDHLDNNSEEIVNTIITMGKHLDFRVLAEGIETEQQLDYLIKQNCIEGQGYYWSKPIQPDQLVKFYKQKSNEHKSFIL